MNRRGAVQITLSRSKTDQEGRDIIKAIPLGDGICCLATVLRKWIDAARFSGGPIFRAITRWDQVQGEGLVQASVNVILTKRVVEGSHGEIMNDRGRMLFETGFTLAILKLLGI